MVFKLEPKRTITVFFFFGGPQKNRHTHMAEPVSGGSLNSGGEALLRADAGSQRRFAFRGAALDDRRVSSEVCCGWMQNPIRTTSKGKTIASISRRICFPLGSNWSLSLLEICFAQGAYANEVIQRRHRQQIPTILPKPANCQLLQYFSYFSAA